MAEPEIIDPNPLGDEAFQAVGAVVHAPSGQRCIATAIDDAKAVTSASCLEKLQELGPVEYALMRPDGAVAYLQIRTTTEHPSLDVALVRLRSRDVGARWYPSAFAGRLAPGCQGLAVSFATDGVDNETARLRFSHYEWLTVGGRRQLAGLAFKRRLDRASQTVCEADLGSPVFVAGKLAGVLVGLTYAAGEDDGDPVPLPADCALVKSAHYVAYAAVKPWIDAVTD